MAAMDLAGLFLVGIDILRTTVTEKTKKIVAQIGSVTEGAKPEADNVEWWQHVGFASRPSNPQAGSAAAQAFVVRQGGHDVALASQDLRGLTLYGQLAPGETCLYAAGPEAAGQARILLKADGSINLFTKEGGVAGGAGMGIFVNPDGSISIASANGAAVLIADDGALKMFNASGGIQIKANGDVKVASGSKVEISGGSITMGGPAALPLAKGPQTVTALAGLQTQITALQVECAAIAAALVAVANIAGPIVPATHGAAAAAATAAVGVGLGAVVAGAAAGAATSALIPTMRTSAD